MLNHKLDLLASKLDGKRSGNKYQCKCPCHEDNKNSLSIAQGDTQPIIYHCHAGCDSKTVQAALENILGESLSAQQTNNVVQLPRGYKSQPEATYRYYSTKDTLVFEKLRFPNKSFRFRHIVDGKWVYKKPECPPLLYYQVKLDRLRGKVPVIICEGEKDCDNLNKLLGDDYVAVTNDNGAAGWSVDYSKLLEGCDVIIAEDNDKAGRERSSVIGRTAGYKSLLGVLRFTTDEVGEKGDVSDWLAKGHSVDELRERLTSKLGQLGEVDIREGKRSAMSSDYIELFLSELGEIRRDIFTGKSLFYDKEECCWSPADNQEQHLKSIVRDRDQVDKKKRWSAAAVIDHLARHKNSLTPRIVPDIPQWDHEDRLDFLASKVKLRPEAGVSDEAFRAIAKEWAANIFRKVKDPSMNSSPSREFILILSGNQGIGKDYWIRSMLCGLGQWLAAFVVSHNDRDVYMQLHQAMVLVIAEFDKTSRMDSGLIKDLITADHTMLRASYDRSAQYRKSRCSFIASCNITDVFRDYTGASRYAMFEVEAIDRSYTKSIEFSLQCLAQAQELAETDYTAPKELWAEVAAYRDARVPQAPELEVADVWESVVSAWLDDMKQNNFERWQELDRLGWAQNQDCFGLLEQVCKRCGEKLRRVQILLKNAGMGVTVWHNGKTVKGYMFRRS